MIKKENQQHQPWSKEDSQFAWDYFAKGKSHDWIEIYNNGKIQYNY